MSEPTDNFDFQNFYSATLTSDIVAGTLVIPLDTAPTPTEGVLVIDPDSTSPEVIYYTSKGASSVTCPADGRGWDDTTATSHGQGTTVIMAPTAYAWRMLKNGSLFDSYRTGWTTLGDTPDTVTANGNRSYDLVFGGNDLTDTVSPGMRLKLTRTVTAPTGSITLNGTTQYLSKSSPAGMTFTDDFTVSAWVKLSSYAASDIVSRWNGTSGWSLGLQSTGQVILTGWNGGSGNQSYVTSYQSIPLNKWVHVSAQLDMSTFTATTTTSYVMIDGVDVPASVSRAGTNPTALVQAGNLEIGAKNGGTSPFPGQIAQVAIYSAKVTQATIKASMNQTLSGSETSLVSAYKLDQASGLNDLSANANNLTANGSPSYSTTATPFTQDVTGTSVTAGTTNYAIITKASFSTNTTLTVQVPEGDTIPTSGGVSAVSYSTQKVPYGFPSQRGKWRVLEIRKAGLTKTSAVASTWQNTVDSSASVGQITIPTGEWLVTIQSEIYSTRGASGLLSGQATLSSTTSTETNPEFSAQIATTGTAIGGMLTKTAPLSLSSATVYYRNIRTVDSSNASLVLDAGAAQSEIIAENAYL